MWTGLLDLLSTIICILCQGMAVLFFSSKICVKLESSWVIISMSVGPIELAVIKENSQELDIS